MDELTEKIHIQYLEEEIKKMQKTASGLKKMIDKKDPKKDVELIDSLQNIRSNTIKNIKEKQRELEEHYNKYVEEDNN